MVKIPTFEVERWMDENETTPGVLNVAETCAASISLSKLVTLNSRKTLAAPPINFDRVMTYGAIRGSDELRRGVANLFSTNEAGGETGSGSSPVKPEDVLITNGAIAANHLVFYTLVGPGDHVVCVYPTYQQLYSVPETLGAEVSLWRLKPENGFIPDVADLETLIKSNTKMIVINNPNNPSGAVIPNDILLKIADVARRHDIILLSDEVYAPLFHGLSSSSEPPPSPPSALALGYARTVVTGSMSKAWALAGIRVGWLASSDASIIEAAASARDYTTISVSQLDDQVAAYALSDTVRPHLLSRNLDLARHNLALLDAFVTAHAKNCAWAGDVRPRAGTTAFLRFQDRDARPVDDVAFCTDLLGSAKVLLVPGSRCFGNGNGNGGGGGGDFAGYVRFGYVCETEVLEVALRKLGAYVAARLT